MHGDFSSQACILQAAMGAWCCSERVHGNDNFGCTCTHMHSKAHTAAQFVRAFQVRMLAVHETLGLMCQGI